MKMFLLLLMSCCASLLYAQDWAVPKPYALPQSKQLPRKGTFSNGDFLKQPSNRQFKLLLPRVDNQLANNIPDAIDVKLLSNQLVYQGNNNNGLDIYSATTDNMPVVKPDSTFTSTMPVMKSRLLMMPMAQKKNEDNR